VMANEDFVWDPCRLNERANFYRMSTNAQIQRCSQAHARTPSVSTP
jgi:hypothetical protein